MRSGCRRSYRRSARKLPHHFQTMIRRRHTMFGTDPGIIVVRLLMLRAYGKSSSFCWLQLTATVAASRSIVGAVLVTVTSSATVATSRFPFTVLVVFAATGIPSMFNVLKPARRERHPIHARDKLRKSIGSLFVGNRAARTTDHCRAGDCDFNAGY